MIAFSVMKGIYNDKKTIKISLFTWIQLKNIDLDIRFKFQIYNMNTTDAGLKVTRTVAD
jgi:hypothetical protein